MGLCSLCMRRATCCGCFSLRATRGCCTPSCAPGTLTHLHACLQRFLHAWGTGLSPTCNPTGHTCAHVCPHMPPSPSLVWARRTGSSLLMPSLAAPALCSTQHCFVFQHSAFPQLGSDQTLMIARTRSLSPGAGSKTSSSLGKLWFG